jgi:hypothetical protein
MYSADFVLSSVSNHSLLEQNLQSANAASASARFREQSLQQELDLTKKNNEWFETRVGTLEILLRGG